MKDKSVVTGLHWSDEEDDDENRGSRCIINTLVVSSVTV